MSIFRLDWWTLAPPEARGGILTLGNFDGVHRGHVHLLHTAKAHAHARGVPTLAVTFDPHPLQLLRPDQFEPMLTTAEERARVLHEAGTDHVVVLQTEATLLALSAREFFAQVIRGNLQAVGLVEGPNFGFGRNREGTTEMLARFCADAGLMFEIVPPLQLDGTMVSSSRIRKSLLAGDIAAATRGLGRPYSLTGTVGIGQKRGRQLGFPTANLTQVPTLIPGDGVYAVRAFLGESVRAWEREARSDVHGRLSAPSYAAAANIGPNPTFGEQARKIEVHLIGFDGDLYGQSLTVDFTAWMRDTRKFASVQELRNQIEHDAAQAKDIHLMNATSALKVH